MTHTARIVAITQPRIADQPEMTASQFVAYAARVSNPANQANSLTATRLLRYLINHAHWSPFEMVHVVMEITTTRDIGRQILRHRSFSFQEFCVSGETKITLELPNGTKRGKRLAYTRTIAHLFSLQQRGMKMPSGVRVFDEVTRTFVTAGIRKVFQTGVKPIFRVILANGRSVDCTKEHKFLTEDGFISIEDAVGIRIVGGTAVMSKSGVSIACNGVPAYQEKAWLSEAKRRCIASGTGLAGIASEAGVTTHTIRKALKRHGLQFTKLEVASYTQVWNKGLTGYSLPRHSTKTIEKMRASANRGAASNLWRGGADRSERIKITDWCAANRSDFLRAANYKCRRCESNNKLELHHIQTVSDRPDLAYDRTNIEVLCYTCHRSHHRINGDAKSWRERSRGNTLTINWSVVEKIEYLGEQMTYDMEIEHESHNYVANGIVTHNSQRYAAVEEPAVWREARMQAASNRQSSTTTDDTNVISVWHTIQARVAHDAKAAYEESLALGIAREQARSLLPEGLTATRMYMAGTLRSWIHYIDVRITADTQHEHRLVALDAQREILIVVPDLSVY